MGGGTGARRRDGGRRRSEAAGDVGVPAVFTKSWGKNILCNGTVNLPEERVKFTGSFKIVNGLRKLLKRFFLS